ncbi:MAG: hypothetical protein H5T44_00910 [Thermoplasmatales archaeon]|nr:hypothetical protein [Thermoplasmatales archaeon]
MNEERELTVGSKYIVYSIGPGEELMQTSGTFVGYCYISKEEGGICIKMDETHGAKKGMTRIIPIEAIIAIDIVEEKKIEKKEEKHYFR